MRLLRAWAVRMASLLDAGRRERELQDEIESHLQLHTDDNIRAGMSPREARRAALVRLGGIEALKERHRDRRGVPPLQHAWRDLHYAVRVLRRNPTFSVITVLTLALGIGANTSIFTLVNAVLLRPLPYAEADRLAIVWGTDAATGNREVSISYPDFEDWQSGTTSFEHAAALTTRSVTVGSGDLPELVRGVQTTPAFFRVLRVDALLGRTFDDVDAAASLPAAVLSDGAWKRQFAARGDVVGRTVTVNGVPHVVIGVVPAAMHFIPTEVEQVYTLLPRESDRRHGYLRFIARLRPGASFQSAQAELDLLTRRTAAMFPATHATAGASVVPLAAAVGAPVRDGLLILLALVGAVLLIACTNVANLLLARNAARQHELALRISLGASRGRILQQLLVESLVLAACGGAAGLLVAQVVTSGLIAELDGAVPVPRLESIRMDTVVFAFAFLVSIVTGLLTGVVPALVAAPGRLGAAAREAGRQVAGSRGARRARAMLVVLETALALVLLAAAAMLARSFLELRATAPGFVADDVLAVGLRLPPALAPGAAREAFFEEVRTRLEAVPGVRSAGFVSSLPLSGGYDRLRFTVPGQPHAKPVPANFNIASPGYFRTLQIPVVAGREFTELDDASAAGAIVVNETAARRFWTDTSPIGRTIVISGESRVLTVVGIVGDVRQADLGTAPQPEIFLCALQPGPSWDSFALVVAGSSDLQLLVPEVRAVLRTVNRDVALARIAPMRDVVAGSLLAPRVYSTLLGAFGAAGLVLAAVGVYGVISYSVAQRRRELGIRLALGSSPAALVGSVLRHGAGLTAAGIAIGLVAAYAATQSVAALVPSARAGDPITLAAVAALMLLVGVAASYFPARRAAGVDPLAALRVE